MRVETYITVEREIDGEIEEVEVSVWGDFTRGGDPNADSRALHLDDWGVQFDPDFALTDKEIESIETALYEAAND